MGKSEFVHLHLHTQYSLLDGAIRLHELFPRLAELGQTAVAMTDHGVMFGIIDFYKQARAAKIKPILGCEIYVAPGARDDKTRRGAGHLVLLARNLDGYKNLIFLVSKAHLEGFFYHPRIDRALLAEHSAGLIGLSACVGGDVPRATREQGEGEGERVALAYRELFEPGAWYLEVQSTGDPVQDQLNAALRRISQKTGIPLVATNDAHYLYKEDSAAHDILMRIQEGKTIRDAVNLQHSQLALYLRSAEEMRAALPDYLDAVERTVEIAERCNVELSLEKAMLPEYPIPAGETRESYLGRLTEEGLRRRFDELRRDGKTFEEKDYRKRIKHELKIICDKGYAGYFLIVQDFIAHARDEGIPVGPGRGSGAGSLVAWCLRITDIDPMRFGLLFERFLNPERPSMPDFDVDFCKERRDEVIQYVTKKYGEDRVGQIATFHQIKSRSAVKDVGRVLEVSFQERDRLAKLIPPPTATEPSSIEKAIEVEPRLRQEYEHNPDVRRLLDFAARLEGLHRHAGQHAAGVVIGNRPLWEIVPVFRSKDGVLVSQYDMNAVEAVGLVKFDFLGLKNLTTIDKTEKLIRRRPGQEQFRIGSVPLDDKASFDLMTSGQTLGVFQLESRGFRELLKRLKPDRIEDIVAAVALFRPGPLGVGADERYIRRKHGQEPITCLHEILGEVCDETYGVLLYQEQVMQIAVRMAGYTLGGADKLRKAMGKKKKDVMEQAREPFVEGSRRKGVDDAIAIQVFEDLAKFAEYAFNKSHSAAYAVIAYQTAWLKAHYPVEFLAALLTCDRDDTDRVVRYISEARAHGIPVLPPDVNESGTDFDVVAPSPGAPPDRIRFGLGAVRGVGGAALEAVLAARAEGPFQDLFDFTGRVDPRPVNRGVLEALIKSGAFDGCAKKSGVSRAAMFASVDRALEFGRARQRDRQIGQTGLFDVFLQGGGGAAPAEAAAAAGDTVYAAAEEWDEGTLLRHERESVGAYLSGHPLHRYQEDLARAANCIAAEVEERAVGSELKVGGLVEGLVERINKKTGRRTAVFQLEDLTGAVETFVPPQALERLDAVLHSGQPILCSGRVETAQFRDPNRGGGDDSDDETVRFVLTDAVRLQDERLEHTRAVHVLVGAGLANEAAFERLRKILDESRGNCAVFLHLRVPNRGEAILALPDRWRVSPTDPLIVGVQREFGTGSVTLQ
ncbi:MAG: DNA polymerase III subunit alpha [Deltaproteobacteria bacterium]|nr:DNA polymerase III subunit alpha [Deltaproteobacteria bacterium]